VKFGMRIDGQRRYGLRNVPCKLAVAYRRPMGESRLLYPAGRTALRTTEETARD
jgi:hypothetical protein